MSSEVQGSGANDRLEGRLSPFGEPPERRPRPVHFVVQSLLATALVAGVLLLVHSAAKFVVVAALGSTAFLVFARPKSVESRPRKVIGGHLCSIAAGALCAWPVWRFAFGGRVGVVILAALAVGISTLVMSATDTEHAPAAGVALAMVVGHEEMPEIALVAAAGAAAACLAGCLLRRWLRDLT